MANPTNIPAPRVPLIDLKTGLISREWFMWFINQFTLTGSGSGAIPGTQMDNFTSTTSGAVPASSGGAFKYLRADGSWTEPVSSAITVELDFGTVGMRDKAFTVTDSNVTSAKKIIFWHTAIAATGKSVDENEMDTFVCRCVPGAGSFVVYISSLFGPVVNKFKFEYLVG